MRLNGPQGRIVLNSFIDTLKELQAQGRELPAFTIAFSMGVAPGRELNTTESINLLDKFLQVASSFEKDTPMQIDVQLAPVDSFAIELDKLVGGKAQAAIDLQASAEKQKKKLITSTK